MSCTMADLGFKQVSVEPVVAQPEDDYAIREEDIPKICEEYDKLAAEMVKRKKEGRGFNFFHFMIDLTGGPCVAQAAVRLRFRNRVSGSDPMGRFLSLPSVCRTRKNSLWEMWMTGIVNTEIQRRVQVLQRLRQGKMPETALQDSTAAAAVRQIPIISMAPSTMPMISAVSCSASVWSVRL